MKGVADYAVVYDITSDTERGRVDRVLKGFGFRVQKSVYECRLKKRERDELIEKMKRLDIKTGFIKVYRVEYASRDHVIGDRKRNDIDDGHAFII
jgi:CRISPR-associated protein Cas2